MTKITAKVAIQCRPAPGQPAATFLFIGDRTEAGYVLVSPALVNSVALFDWLKREGWERVPAYHGQHPCGEYAKG